MIYKVNQKRYVDSGAFKHAYRVGKDKIALVSGYDPKDVSGINDVSPKAEMEALATLKTLGIPVVKVYGIHKAINEAGRAHPALIEEYVAPGKYNATTLKDLKRIRAIVSKKKLSISDFQYLIRKNGHVAVNDPGVVDICGEADDVESTISILDYEIDLANNEIAYNKKKRHS